MDEKVQHQIEEVRWSGATTLWYGTDWTTYY